MRTFTSLATLAAIGEASWASSVEILADPEPDRTDLRRIDAARRRGRLSARTDCSMRPASTLSLVITPSERSNATQVNLFT
jgi:hypothetical protein